MRLEQMRYVLEIEKTHSISAAATNLFVTPSTISESIKKLEDELNMMLFIRSKQGMTLTPEGEKVVAECKKISEHINNIYQLSIVHAQRREEVTGQLKLSICFGMGHTVLTQILSTFQKCYPHIALSVSEKAITQVLHDLQSNICDIAFLYCSDNLVFQEICEKYTSDALSTEEFCALIKSDHKLSDHSAVSLEQISKYPVAIYGLDDMLKSEDRTLNDLFFGLGLDFNVVFRSNDILLFKNHLLETNSVGVTPEIIASSIPQKNELVQLRILDRLNLMLRYFYDPQSDNVNLTRLFIEITHKCLHVPLSQS